MRAGKVLSIWIKKGKSKANTKKDEGRKYPLDFVINLLVLSYDFSGLPDSCAFFKI